MKKLTIGLFLFLVVSALMISCSNDIDKPSDSDDASSRYRGGNSGGDYVVFAWNDLGMHCLNPSYDQAVILPPYNTIWAQVVKRGNPPQIVTNGVQVEYTILNNTYSYGKLQYGGFWDYAEKLFGVTNLQHDIGLTGNGLSGTMTSESDHFEATGIPVTPVNDKGVWSPYQQAEITVKDKSNNVLVKTKTTVPVSDEINCGKCHGDNAFADILKDHDEANGTDLANNAPVLCASCHGSPVLGTSGPGSSGKYLSQAIHGFHADKGAVCYDCHPGKTTKCSRSLSHTADDGNCTTCHGDMRNVSNSVANGRQPWESEPKCVTCHQGVQEVETGDVLYRNAKGHGNLYCATCHGSPHAMYPSAVTADNYQTTQYVSVKRAKSIGSCGACHNNSRGESDMGDFAEIHGRTNPKIVNTCGICHTSISTNTSKWPHGYQWKNSLSGGTGGGGGGGSFHGDDD